MSETDSGHTSFLAELKRRHVIQAGILYLIVAFAVIEGADLVAPRLGIPEWAVTALVVCAVVGFPVILVLAWVFEFTSEGLMRTESFIRGGATAEDEWAASVAVTDDGRRSIAVLPFADMSPEHDHEYFSDGMSEELINALTKLEDLRVAARTSAFAFKGKGQDVRAIGRKLGVETVLEGSVRKAENRLRITAQLINVADGYHLWSETYDRELEDVFAIQDEISQAIVSTLEIELGVREGESLVPAPTQDMEAYELYLKGRHFWFKRYKVGLQTAVELFQKAAAKDPEFALPYTGISDAFMGLGAYGFIPPDQARAVALPAAERALALDDTLAEAHIAMGRALVLKWDWDGAEAAIKRGTELNPQHAEGLGQWGVFVVLRGRLEEALERVERARAIDPDSLRVAIQAASVRLSAQRYDEALREFEWVLEREPEAVDALTLLGSAYSVVSRHDEAIATTEKAVALSNRAPPIFAQLGVAYGQAGMEREAQAVMDELLQRSESEYVAPVCLAVVSAALGRTADVLEYLKAAIDEVSPAVFAMAFLPVWDAVRSDASAAALLEQTGL